MVQKKPSVAQRHAPQRPFFPQDSGFRTNPNSGFLFESDPQESPNRHGYTSVCLSDVSDSCPKSSNNGLSGEYFQHAPSSWTRVGETSISDDARQEHHVHGLHPCAHPCCLGTGTSIRWIGVCCGLKWSWGSWCCAPVFPTGVSIWHGAPGFLLERFRPMSIMAAALPLPEHLLTGWTSHWHGAPEFPL